MILYTDKHRVPFQIDEADYEAVSRYAWHLDTAGYPVTHFGKWPRTRHGRLHALLLGPAPAGLQWDHRDRDKLNNQRGNLRAVTGTVNQRNKGLQSNNSSGINGVHWDPERNKWRAEIRLPGLNKNLGRFDSIAEASSARKVAEELFWKER